jgi:glycosyltransferase involved in cell wall biosynthesis
VSNQTLPLVSVLMVTYNSERFLTQAIESVLQQDYANFELVIVDDNSTDNSFNIINSYQDNRIRKFKNERNLGEYPNRDKAISLARGEYMIFIDGDDLMYHGGLSFMMDFALLYSECALILSKGWDERIVYPKVITSVDFYRFEYLDNGITALNFTKILFKAEALKSRPFFPSYVKLGDVYLQYIVAMENKSVLIPDASTWWRRTPGQASEKLLKDLAFHSIHDLWIKLDMLKDERCPLDPIEKMKAFSNIYIGHLHNMLRLLLKLRIATVFRLLKRYPIPTTYIVSIFKRQQRGYFKDFNASNPF